MKGHLVEGVEVVNWKHKAQRHINVTNHMTLLSGDTELGAESMAEDFIFYTYFLGCAVICTNNKLYCGFCLYFQKPYCFFQIQT